MGFWENNAARLDPELLGLVEESLGTLAHEQLEKAKGALKPNNEGPGAQSRQNTTSNPVPTQKATEDPKSLFWDPFAIIEQLGYKDRPSSISYQTLEAMVWRTPIIRAIINTRINQVAAFSHPVRDRYDMGFRIKLRDSDKEPTKIEQKWMRDMETLLTRTGVTKNPRGRANMTTFLKKTVYDSLVYDQYCWEIVPNAKGSPAEWYAIDAATIRLADSGTTYVNEDKADEIRYVQIYDGVVIAEYTQEEMCFGVRNPRTSIRLAGYGESELEMLIPVITSMLWSFEYNQKFFSQGSSTKGLLNFKGVNPRNLEQFRRHWYQMISGVENAFRTPITSADDVQFVNLQQNNRDMEFSAWYDFLLKVACGMFQIDPVEVNFKYGNTGQSSAMNEANNREKVTLSKERGLRPILGNLAENFNQYLIYPINENFELEFVGLDAETKEEFADLTAKKVKTTMMVDELRAKEDLPPLPDGKGKVILDPTWMQHAQMKDAAAQGMMDQDQENGNGNANGAEASDNEDDDADWYSKLKQFESPVEEQESGGSFNPPTNKGGKVKKSIPKTWVVKL